MHATLESLKKEHEYISEQVKDLEEKRNHNRSSDLKIELITLKKKRLKIKDRLRYLENMYKWNDMTRLG